MDDEDPDCNFYFIFFCNVDVDEKKTQTTKQSQQTTVLIFKTSNSIKKTFLSIGAFVCSCGSRDAPVAPAGAVRAELPLLLPCRAVREPCAAGLGCPLRCCCWSPWQGAQRGRAAIQKQRRGAAPRSVRRELRSALGFRLRLGCTRSLCAQVRLLGSLSAPSRCWMASNKSAALCLLASPCQIPQLPRAPRALCGAVPFLADNGPWLQNLIRLIGLASF